MVLRAGVSGRRGGDSSTRAKGTWGSAPRPHQEWAQGPGPPVAAGSIFWKARPHRTTSCGPGGLRDGSTQARPRSKQRVHPPLPDLNAPPAQGQAPEALPPVYARLPCTAEGREGTAQAPGSARWATPTQDSLGAARTGPTHGCPNPDHGGRAQPTLVRKTVPDPRNVFQIRVFL